jgi:hypothetical protein
MADRLARTARATIRETETVRFMLEDRRLATRDHHYALVIGAKACASVALE